ncbi:MAG: S1 RNA-binding domain-containing protein, partial [Alphaproteobacteria bacterium]|nr:S1 RNA-binding domain-containing protein [Alphaproteobacteria bacterium]
DGLVHYSDISWTEPGEAAIKHYKKGDRVKAKILAMDVDKERISLGIKQLEHDPLENEFADLKKGATVTCEIVEVQDDGVVVKITDGITGFIKKADLSRERQEQRTSRFAVGDRVDAKITAVDRGTRSVKVSVKALEMDEHKKAIETYGSSDSGATLGDILGAALNEAKTEGKAKAKKKAKTDEDEEEEDEA